MSSDTAESDSSSHTSADSDSSGSEVSLEYDSSSFESKPESSSDHEIHPFMYEPVVASVSGSSGAESEEESETVSSRLLNLDWCSCGNCMIMPTGIECVCCQEITQIIDKTAAEEVGCITLHPGFGNVCLNPWVLQTAYYSYQQHYGENAVEGELNEKYRHVAYRQLTRWCWQWLGKDIHVVLPSCAVTQIRSTFPSTTGVYTGIKFPDLS